PSVPIQSCRVASDPPCLPSRPKSFVHDRLRLLHDATQVILPTKAFHINLVDILGARGPRGEPAAFCNDLYPSDRRVVSRSLIDGALDLLPGQLCASHLLRRESRQQLLLRRSGRSLDPVGNRRTKFARQVVV